MKEVTVIFPTLHNDKSTCMVERVNKLIDRICIVTGGVSVVEQNGIELWKDARYVDASKRVITVCNTDSMVEQIRNIALDAIGILEQRGGIFFQVVNVETVQWLDVCDVPLKQETEYAYHTLDY